MIDPQTAAPRAIHLAGSTTLAPLVRLLAEERMDAQPGLCIVVEATGTARGYKAVLEGTADIAMASGPLPEDPADGAAYRALRAVTLGADPVAILVHAANPVTALDTMQLVDILAGRIGNWREVGGIDSPITVFVGLPGGGVAASIRALMGTGASFTPARQVLPTAERLPRAAADPAAITYATEPLPAGLALKPVAIGGRRAGMSGYPIQAPSRLVVAAHAPAALHAFIAALAAHWRQPGSPA